MIDKTQERGENSIRRGSKNTSERRALVPATFFPAEDGEKA